MNCFLLSNKSENVKLEQYKERNNNYKRGINEIEQRQKKMFKAKHWFFENYIK